MRRLAFVLGFLLVSLLPAQGQKIDKDVLAQMRAGGISLRTATLPIGPAGAQTLVHLYVTPPPQYENGKKVSVSRESITVGTSLPMSPMYLDLFQRTHGAWTRINAVKFTEDGDAVDMTWKWLDPKTKHSPILLLRFGVGDQGEWKLFVFPDGVNGNTIQQEFSFGGDAEGGTTLAFDQVDSKGQLVVKEDWGIGERAWTSHYAWNGAKFVKFGAYFVVAASVKTEKEARAFIDKHGIVDADILRSNAYKNLTPGYYVVVLSRSDSLAEAQETAASYQKDKVSCYVKRAY